MILPSPSSAAQAGKDVTGGRGGDGRPGSVGAARHLPRVGGQAGGPGHGTDKNGCLISADPVTIGGLRCRR